MASNADLIAAYTTALLDTHVICAVTALVCYEYLITFKYEIDFLWRRKWSAGTWIFVLNRYFMLATVIMETAPANSWICADSQAMNTLTFFTSGTLSMSASLAFNILRTLAILQDHPWKLVITGSLCSLTLAGFTLDACVLFMETWSYFTDPILGPLCNQVGYSASPSIMNHLLVATIVASVLSSSLVLAVTLTKTARQVQQASSLGLKATLSEIMLRDGSMYFLITLIINILVTIPVLDSGAIGFLPTPIFNILPSMLLSRFIINLRQAGSPSATQSAHQRLSRFSIPNFRMPTMDEVVGNLGEPLEFSEYHLDDEDGAQDDGATANDDTEEQGTENPTSGTADLEAGSSSNGSWRTSTDAVGQITDSARSVIVN